MTITDSDHCPECGQRVRTFKTNEGDSYYLAVAEQEASEADYLRDELKRAKAEREHYHAALERMTERKSPDGLAVHALATVHHAHRTQSQ